MLPRVELVLRELLPHEPPRRLDRETEAAAKVDGGLEPEALGAALVPLAAEVPRLVGEHGERTPRAAVGDLAVEGEPVEVEAALGREVREVAADLGHAVGMLHRADVLARLVAADPYRPADEARRLRREARGRLPLRLVVDAVPAAAALDHDHDGDERGDQRQPREQTRERPAGHDDARLLALARLGDQLRRAPLRSRRGTGPDLALLVADEDELRVVAAVAELLAVDVLRQPSAAPRRRLLPQPRGRRARARARGRRRTAARWGRPRGARAGRAATRRRARRARRGPRSRRVARRRLERVG